MYTSARAFLIYSAKVSWANHIYHRAKPEVLKKKSNLLYLLISTDLEKKGLLQEPGITENQSLEVPYGGDMHQKLMN